MNHKSVLAQITARWNLGVDRLQKLTQPVPPAFLELSVIMDYINSEGVALPRNGRALDIDWAKQNWNQSSVDLAKELGVSISTVHKKKIMLGLPRTKLLRTIDWAKVDWTKNDQELSALYSTSAGNIRKYRQRAGAKPAFQLGMSKPRRVKPRITAEIIAAQPWEELRDVDVARTLGVTRERARQIRLVNHKPQCIYGGCNARTIEVLKVLKGRHEEVTGKSLVDIMEILKPVSPHCLRPAVIRAMRHLCLPFTAKRKEALKYPFATMDWRLGNKTLQMIYGAPNGIIPSARCRYLHPSPTLSVRGGFSTFWNKPGFQEALEAELLRSEALGFKNREGVMGYINQLKADSAARRLAKGQPRPARHEAE